MRLAILLAVALVGGCNAGREEVRTANVAPEVNPRSGDETETGGGGGRNNEDGDRVRGGNDELAEAQTSFAVDLYSRLDDREGNLFLSPFSIASVMTMVAAGARGETAEQMTRVLHLAGQMENAHEAFGGAFEDLNESEGIELSTANAAWVQSGLGIERGFRNTIEKNYRAGLKSVDYRAAPEPARGEINAWVEKETRERIQDLIPQGAVTPDTRLVLTNAIYFKGDWAQQFKPVNTQPAAFRLIGGGEAQVPFMYQKQRFPLAILEDAQVLELPYRGGEFSMVIVLPNEVDGIKELENSLSAEKAEGWTEKLREVEVEVYLPKFTMTSEFSLADVLAAMGMPLAFSDRADFTGITKEAPLMISGVFHKAFVDVNEEGTEAAAATGAVVSVTSAMPRKFEFRADHPFLFFIRERESGLILFMGRVMDPR